MTTSNIKIPVETFLENYPTKMVSLARQARKLILSVMPGTIIEQVDPSANLLAYGLGFGYQNLICGIIIYAKYLNIMLANGANLTDPGGLLAGTGKKARHMRISSGDQLTDPGVKAMLEAALAFHLKGNR